MDAAGDTDGAIAHLIAAGDETAAAARILAEAPSAALHGRAELIERWLDQLGPWAAERQVDATLASAWAAVGTFAPDAFAGAMARVTMIDPDAVDAPAVALVRAVRGAGGLDRALRDTEVAVDGLTEGTLPWALAVVNRGSARLHLGDVDAAIDDLAGVVDLLEAVPAFAAAAHGHLALLHLDQGDLDRARQRPGGARIVRDAHLDALVLSANPRCGGSGGGGRRPSRRGPCTSRRRQRAAGSAPGSPSAGSR
ncbi:MAG: hypothetical protein R2690_11405 [Acidimicrobiales bacterium]